MLKQLPFFTAMDLENVFDYHITNLKLSYLSKKKNMLNLNELNISVRKLIWTESHFNYFGIPATAGKGVIGLH